MSELTVAEEYRTLVGQSPVGSGRDSATQKVAELGFLKILSELETSLVDTILRSDNLITALTEIAHVNQLRALEVEAFRKASLFGNDAAKKTYHQQMGFQIGDDKGDDKGDRFIFIFKQGGINDATAGENHIKEYTSPYCSTRA